MRADEVLQVLWKRRWVAAITFVVTMAAAAAVTYSLPNVYSSTTLLWVNPEAQEGSDFEATQLSQVLSKTFAELLQTSTIAAAVAQELPFDASTEDIEASVEVQPLDQSQLLKIEAESTSPERARQIGTTYADIFIDRTEEYRVSGVTSSRVSVADPASTASSPSRPKPKLYLLVAGVLALVAGMVVALLRERLDQRLRIGTSTTELLDLPIIGRIPTLAEGVKAYAQDDGSFDLRATAAEDAFRVILTNLAFLHEGREPATVAVTSAHESEGKSTCVASLGHAAMSLGLKAVVVDADLRRPSLAGMFDVDESVRKGLSSYLVRPQRLRDILVETPGMPPLVASGPTPPNPTALLRSPAFSRFDREALEAFDVVIYDTPPLSTGSDALLVAAQAQAVVLVVDARRTRRAAVLQSIDQLSRASAKISGLVVNRFSGEDSTGYHRSGGAYHRPSASGPTSRKGGARRRRGRRKAGKETVS
ncbi:MAG: polysaccharide biosynthesis tyrosine autokinase [Actinomycetota bacterium]|nr:polysaccharide biosynthesis tyrosine autokinase [Actinomycetota bacterium]